MEEVRKFLSEGTEAQRHEGQNEGAHVSAQSSLVIRPWSLVGKAKVAQVRLRISGACEVDRIDAGGAQHVAPMLHGRNGVMSGNGRGARRMVQHGCCNACCI